MRIPAFVLYCLLAPPPAAVAQPGILFGDPREDAVACARAALGDRRGALDPCRGAASWRALFVPPPRIPREAAPVRLSGPPEGPAGGRAILDALREALARAHRPRGYGEARRHMFAQADNVAPDGIRGVLEAYSLVFVAGASGEPRDYPERGDQNGDGFVDREGMNVEHAWPQSFFDRRAPMRSDLHHLLPTFVFPNSVRGHLPFGEVEGRAEYSNTAGARAGSGRFEPPDAVKGRVARAMLYFYVRYRCDRVTGGPYEESFWRDSVDTLLRWHREHPPGPAELGRNDRVERFQGDRNPFVDDPSLADRAGPEAFRQPPGRCAGAASP